MAGQPTVWTFIDFEAPDSLADELVDAITAALEPELAWWADFTIDHTQWLRTYLLRRWPNVEGLSPTPSPGVGA